MNLILCFFLFFSAISWSTDNENNKWIDEYATARRVANEEDKPLLVFFSGSDWCKPCIKLKKHIVDTGQFQLLASDEFVLYNADFPINKKQKKTTIKQNEELAEKYNKEGLFPKIVIVSIQGDVLAEIGYIDCTPNEYFEMIKNKIENSNAVTK